MRGFISGVKLLCALAGRLSMDSSEGDTEVGCAVFSFHKLVRLYTCVCVWDGPTHPVPLVLLLLLHLLLPQAFESPHSSPLSSFRTPQQRRQNSDTNTLSDSVRWTHALSFAFRSVSLAVRSFLLLGLHWTWVYVEMRPASPAACLRC